MSRLYTRALIQRDADVPEGVTRFVASTADPDRMDDIVDQSTWILDGFESNPVILWAHRYDLMPVGRGALVEMRDGALVIDVAWNRDDPHGAAVEAAVKSGFLNAGSVGFFSKSMVPRAALPEEDPRYGKRGYVLLQNELVEFSIVPVPANANALAERGLEVPGVIRPNEIASLRADLPKLLDEALERMAERRAADPDPEVKRLAEPDPWAVWGWGE